MSPRSRQRWARRRLLGPLRFRLVWGVGFYGGVLGSLFALLAWFGVEESRRLMSVAYGYGLFGLIGWFAAGGAWTKQERAFLADAGGAADGPAAGDEVGEPGPIGR